jgi:DNA-directed RNA polymerase specialized sigma24 family protein
MLAAWYAGWQQRHNGILACARVKVPVRVRRTAYLLTAEQALASAASTFEELYRAVEAHTDWGVDAAGTPNELAMQGLIARRLQSRIHDQLRAAKDEELAMTSLDEPVGDDAVTGDLLGSTRAQEDFETIDALRRALADESPQTRHAVLLKLTGRDAPEIAARTGMAPATVRQRLHRFKVRTEHGLLVA